MNHVAVAFELENVMSLDMLGMDVSNAQKRVLLIKLRVTKTFVQVKIYFNIGREICS